MENVPNILAMRNGGYRDEILGSFCEAGYKRISVNTLLASDFGVPQDRRRVFFIGVREISCSAMILTPSALGC
jgi:DNA (cytosine-5)-methyltransferase 1